MQTWLPYPAFAPSASVLDDRRLGAQRPEALVLLRAVLSPPWRPCGACGLEPPGELAAARCPGCGARLRRTPWRRHPAARMWEDALCALLAYGVVMCNEWVRRGHADAVRPQLLELQAAVGAANPSRRRSPAWLGQPWLHASHRGALLGRAPAHYGQFGWTDPPLDSVVWPVPLLSRRRAGGTIS